MSGPVWKKPDEVMKQMRAKKKALQARFSHAPASTTNTVDSSDLPVNESSPSVTTSVKRKNPFR